MKERKGEGTTFTIDRKLFTSDLWHASPWKLKIWIYLVGNANHADGEFMGIKIKRGQILRSLRTIRNECAYKVGYRIKKPSLDTVRRICEDFTKELRTEQRTVQAGTLITLINYNKLQPKKKGEPNGQSYAEPYSSRTGVVHNNNDSKKNNKKNNKNKSIKTLCVESIDCATILADGILSNDPGEPKLQPKTKEATILRWADDIEKINRLDGRSWPDISRVADWVQRDDFEKNNVKSGAKMRKRFSQLLGKASKSSDGMSKNEIDEWLNEIDEKHNTIETEGVFEDD